MRVRQSTPWGRQPFREFVGRKAIALEILPAPKAASTAIAVHEQDNAMPIRDASA